MASLGSKVREWLAAAFAIAAVATSTALIGPETSEVDQIRVGAFNIQVFGKAKRSKPEVMEVLVNIAHEFDVLVVQEVRDASLQTADEFLRQINDQADLTYEMFEGPRLGRSNSKEQYVLYYIPSRVQLTFADVVEDPQDQFERPPLLAKMRAGNFDFTLVAIHIKPDDAEDELQALAQVADALLAEDPDEKDVIVLGDLNADGSYFNEDRIETVFLPDTYHVVIDNSMITTTRSENTYDRIILAEGAFDHEFIAGSAAPFLFDFLVADAELIPKVSDHYPVIAEFDITLADDD